MGEGGVWSQNSETLWGLRGSPEWLNGCRHGTAGHGRAGAKAKLYFLYQEVKDLYFGLYFLTRICTCLFVMQCACMYLFLVVMIDFKIQCLGPLDSFLAALWVG